MARRAVRWSLSEDRLAEITREARRVAAGFTSHAQSSLQRLIHYAERAGDRQAADLLRRVLAVDMAKPANRKGALPAALGLATGAQQKQTVAMVWMMDRLLTEEPFNNPAARCQNGQSALATRGRDRDRTEQGKHVPIPEKPELYFAKQTRVCPKGWCRRTSSAAAVRRLVVGFLRRASRESCNGSA